MPATIMRAERIKELREERGIKRADFARTLGTTWQTLWNIEEGKTTPSFDMGMKIARALGVSAEELAEFGDD